MVDVALIVTLVLMQFSVPVLLIAMAGAAISCATATDELIVQPLAGSVTVTL